jgi:hypothetical protein
MKIHTILIWAALSLSPFISYNQGNKMITNPGATAGYEKLGAVKGTAGVIGDNYYVLENDYGGAFDFNNNIRTILSTFSISSGKLVKRVNLNELVASSKRDMNKILFCDVIVWKGKIIGFYTYKNPSGKEFLANAIVCDANGKVEKDNISIGDFKHTYLDGSFLWQGGLLVNGRNTLAAGSDFQYKFTPDSSRAIVLCAPGEGSANTKFKIYKPGLEEEMEVAVNIPLKSKTADLVDFVLSNDGKIYLATKSYKSGAVRKKISDDDDFYTDIYEIDTKAGNKVTDLSLSIDGKGFNDMNIGLTRTGYPVCFGSYYYADNKKAKGNIQGFYSIKVDPLKFSVMSRKVYDLPDSVIESFSEEKKAAKRGAGLEKKFAVKKIIPGDDEGLYVYQECNVVQTTVRGTTGAMNSYEEVTEGGLAYGIGPDGEIKWAKRIWTRGRNAELATRTDRLDFFLFKGDLSFAYRQGNNKGGVLRLVWLNSKDGYLRYKNLGEFQTYSSFVQNTLAALGNDEYVLTTFIEGDRKNRPVIIIYKFKAE